MKAAQYNTYGGPEVIETNSNADTPQLKDGQILVDVKAASLNPFDYKLRNGMLKDMVPLNFPVTIGGDFSGVVTEIADGVTKFVVGDEVYGQSLVLNGGSGSLADVTSANVKNTAKKPSSVDFNNAASLVLVGISAIQAIEEHLKLAKDQKILIHGGAGGIGSLAVQLAKHIGAYVAVTVGTDDVEYAKSLGADEVIDYKTQNFEEIIKDYDAVFDTVGGETPTKSLPVLRNEGILVSMDQVDEEKAHEAGVTAIAQNSGTTIERLNRLTELVDSGILKPRIDKIFTLDEARKAFEYFESGSPKGKVVIKIKE